jgi:hypothetical protein
VDYSAICRLIPLLLPVAATFVISNTTLEFGSGLRENGFRARAGTAYFGMFKWIGENISKRDVFLIDKTILDFYVNPQRPEFVSFHHFPQSETDIKEWYKCIKLINHGKSPKKLSFSSLPELRENFYELDETILSDMPERYGMKYYLWLTKQNLSFEKVHSVNGHTLYRITTNEREGDIPDLLGPGFQTKKRIVFFKCYNKVAAIIYISINLRASRCIKLCRIRRLIPVFVCVKVCCLNPGLDY